MFSIELERLTKRYGGRRGIEEVSLSVPAGTVFGFIGPNGAGKSTAIRTLLGLLRPTSGQARLLGRDTAREGAVARLAVGYVPGEIHLHDELTVRQELDFLGGFHAGDHARRRGELVELLEVDLVARTRELPLGNRKKVAIVAALQHRPKVVILDEPTSGLDPVIQARLFQLLVAEAGAGATIFFSSHVLSEVQRLCETVAIIAAGRLVAIEDVSVLRGRQVRRVRATLSTGASYDQLAALAGVSELRREGEEVRLVYRGHVPALMHALAAMEPADVLIEEPSLEEIVLAHYLGGEDGVAE